MTTPPTPSSASSADRTAALAVAVGAIARHITGRQEGDEADALTALGLSENDARAITGT